MDDIANSGELGIQNQNKQMVIFFANFWMKNLNIKYSSYIKKNFFYYLVSNFL